MRLNELISLAVSDLSSKTDCHTASWGLGNELEWFYDQEVNQIRWSFEGERTVSAVAEVVGTFNEDDETWLWSWANSSVDKSTCAEQVREYGVLHDFDDLIESKSQQNLDECWQLAAIAMYICGKQGVYKGRDGSVHVFFCFGTVVIEP